MKKVVIITNIPSPYRVDLFDYLKNNRNEQYDIHVIFARRDAKHRKWFVDEDKIKDDIFLKSRCITIKKRYDIKYIYLTSGLFKALNKINPDIIIASEYNPTALKAAFWSKLYKKKYVSWTDATEISERNLNIMQKWSRKYIIGMSDAFLGSSTKSRELQIKYGASPEKCYISLLTVDVDKYIYPKQNYNGNRIVCVGTLIQRKGIDLLIDALSEVKHDFMLTVAGEGPELESLKKQAEKLGILSKIKFVGFVDSRKMKELYSNNDIFILPTREDCFALVTLEAMCAGLPVIVSKYADGYIDLVEEEKNGFVIDPYNKEIFAKTIDKLLGDTKKMKEFGERGLEVVNKFSFDEVSKGFYDVIDFVGEDR